MMTYNNGSYYLFLGPLSFIISVIIFILVRILILDHRFLQLQRARF